MTLEVEDRLLTEFRCVEIAGVNDDFVILGLRLRDNDTVGIDDDAAAKHRIAVFHAGFADGDHPGRVLLGAGLKRQLVMKDALLWPLYGFLRVHRRRVLA